MNLSAAARNRWRRTWRSRAAVAGASVVAVGAGAAAIAATNPAASGAALAPSTTTPARTEPAPRPQSLRDYLREQIRELGGDDWNPAAGRWDDRGLDPDGDDWTGAGATWGERPQWQQPQTGWQAPQHTATRGS